ncbi:hypothetical protein [Microbacterium laevaniformans]|uniref:hypothetical protein n=2 Tax=Microbacterium laevaniformans TaxID=36807 RepID=UPI00195C97E9|nr:hypothetical protein [Microbacterium laevaniformans]
MSVMSQRDDMRHRLLAAAAHDEEVAIELDEDSARSLIGAALDVIGMLLGRCRALEHRTMDDLVTEIRADLLILGASAQS